MSGEAKKNPDRAGLQLGGSVVGKCRFRIRERHLAEHLVPLMRSKALGAAKLDLVLRCIALPPRHAGKRTVGQVLPRHSWERLHDLARTPTALGSAPVDLDASPVVLRLKRKWVGVQLARLEEMSLVRRIEVPGKQRPKLVVLRDDGSGKPFDDPNGTTRNTYLTIHGTMISSATLATWGTPELSAYLAAMFAERHDGELPDQPNAPGVRSWFRPLGWFADKEKRFGTPARVRVPFSVPTLERGLGGLQRVGLLSCERITVNPRTGERLNGPRNFYTNRFDRFEDPALLTSLSLVGAESAADP